MKILKIGDFERLRLGVPRALDSLSWPHHIGGVPRDRGCLTDHTAAKTTAKVRAGTPAATKSRTRGISFFQAPLRARLRSRVRSAI